MTKSRIRQLPTNDAAPSLPWLLRGANQRYRSAVRDGLSAAGFGDIAQTGFWALDAIAHGASDAQQLGLEMGVTKQAVSKVVEGLVAGGYLERRTNEADRRKTDLVLTARGQQAVKVIAEAVMVTDREFEASLGQSGVRRLRGLLSRLSGSN